MTLTSCIVCAAILNQTITLKLRTTGYDSFHAYPIPIGIRPEEFIRVSGNWLAEELPCVFKPRDVGRFACTFSLPFY